MIVLRRDEARRHVRRDRREVWLTFDPKDGEHPLALGFGALERLEEDLLPPGAGVPHRPYHDAEVVTYVLDGAIAHEDSNGRACVIRAGEFHRMTTGRGIRHTETNASRDHWSHVFQIWLRPSEAGLEPSQEQKRFSAAERRGSLRVVASLDGRRGSLRLHQDVLIHSALLEPGQHVVHELAEGRSAWLHVVAGDAALADFVLSKGDGAGISAERAVSLTAREQTEILLIDLGPHSRGDPR